jgi:dienelactone hydrolase
MSKKKIISYLILHFLVIFSLVIPKTVLSDGPPKPKQWKGKGTIIEFQSVPSMTIKDFLIGKKPERQVTISGTLNFPANAPEKNAPVVVLLHGWGGIKDASKHWMKVFNSMGLATFMVDSNWARRNCKKDNNFKKAIAFCAGRNKGMNRIIDGYRALELLSKHPRIDPDKIGCIGMSLGARGCLYLNVKRFQKMWGTPGLDYAASVPMYPPCNVIFKEDDEITDTPIRIHVGELDTYVPSDSCVNYVERLRAKGKDVEVKVYPNTHHGFEAPVSGGKSGKSKGHSDGKCYYEENSSLPVAEMAPDDVAVISQIGFNEWYATATKKEKKKVFGNLKGRHKSGWRVPWFQFDKSCVRKYQILAHNKDSSAEAEKLVREFFTETLMK